MKTRFNTYDIVCGVAELQKLKGLRVNQIYDIDNKTYLIRFQGGEKKCVLLLESGNRFHTTSFEWPKNVAPSGFSMKLRKHLKNKRLESVQQLGVDRVVDFQFGIDDAAYHVILELYDRGNIILTDHEHTILYVLRPHSEGEEVRFAVREKYPMTRAKQRSDSFSEATLRDLLLTAKHGDNLRRILLPVLDCGPAVIEHVLHKYKLDKCIIENESTMEQAYDVPNKKGNKKNSRSNKISETRKFNMETDLEILLSAIKETEEMLQDAHNGNSKGYIVRKREEKPSEDGIAKEIFYQNIEFHPFLFAQLDKETTIVFDNFLLAVDEFFSNLEGQKIDMKTIQQERDVLKKLSNVKNDHAKRLEQLFKVQEDDKRKAELITNNQDIVDKAIFSIRTLIAQQMSWPDIKETVKHAQDIGDPIAAIIHQLKLESNKISLKLKNVLVASESDENDSDNETDDSDDHVATTKKKQPTDETVIVEVDLGISAWANARKYYDQKRSAAKKEQKTIDASEKALKSAEKKTVQALKEVRTISTIFKARKVYWFEKFYWFISSENYLVIAGRDAQQNELIVKRYMRPSDIYVHAEIQGASSVVIRNPIGGEVPPKTLLEAGTMAISYSVAWDAKVVTNSYWVYSNQVTKTAPTGEYLGTGSFMIRGKKNFLPTCHLIMGLSLLFKLEDSFVDKHRGERKIRNFNDEEEQTNENIMIENEILDVIDEDSMTNADTSIIEEKQGDVASFPDVEVKIEHDTGRITVRTDSITENEKTSSIPNSFEMQKETSLETGEATLIPAAPPRIKQIQKSKKRKEEKAKNQKNAKGNTHGNQDSSEKDLFQAKRGHKGKLKKMKEKYKDQDEEERRLRMQILKSSGKDDGQNVIEFGDGEQTENDAENKEKRKNLQKQQPEPQIPDENDDMPQGDVEMLDSLTGLPFEDDEILFVVPVVAPYQALQNYKFKVKITPGTGKRGKAVKTALAMFSKEKTCSLRERDLVKSLKEEVVARNMPGKVKISAPQMQKFKK